MTEPVRALTPQVFPEILRASGALFVPPILALALMVFGLIRVLFTRTYKRAATAVPV